MGLDIKVEKKKEGYYVISLVGSIDSDTYTELERQLKPILVSSTKALNFNMEGVNYLSSIGFGVIFKTREALEKNGGSLAITGLQPNVKKLFDAVKAIPESLFATMEEADDYLDAYLAYVYGKDKDK